MKIIVEVTKRDIDKGQVSNAMYCPVALALRRALPYAHRINMIIVGPDYAELYHWRNGHRVIQLGRVAATAISEFDHHRPIEPFEFEIDVPREILS